MSDRHHVLTPEALLMMDTIDRAGSFAAAARELGKVPSALTYSVRQLEEALDVLLFDRRSRQAQLTEAGQELLREGRLLLQQLDAVANRVKRVASGWESELTVTLDKAIAPRALFDLIEGFYALTPPTRLKMRSEVMTGTWETLVSGQADLAIGVPGERMGHPGIRVEPLGDIEFILCVSPHHPLAQATEPLDPCELAQHRIVAVADSARGLEPSTIGILPGQDVLTVPTMAAKLEAQLRGIGCGFLPAGMVQSHLAAGRLVHKRVDHPPRRSKIHYAWRQNNGRHGHALTWWLRQLESPTTRQALMDLHEGLVL